jgi:hypothetical protein
MLLPTIFLITIFTTSLILGLVILLSVPYFRLTIPNLIVFVIGAAPGLFLFSLLYLKLSFSVGKDAVSFLGMIAFVSVGGTFVGALAVRLKMRFTNAQDIDSRRKVPTLD